MMNTRIHHKGVQETNFYFYVISISAAIQRTKYIHFKCLPQDNRRVVFNYLGTEKKLNIISL